MRSIDFHPSSTSPVSAQDLVLYADKWVFVRSGKVVQQAATRHELMTKCASRCSESGDRFLHLPPMSPRLARSPAAPR